MVRVAVGQHHDVDVFGLEAGGSELGCKPAAVRPRDESSGAIAGIEQDELLARVDDSGRKSRLVALLLHQVVAHKLADFILRRRSCR